MKFSSLTFLSVIATAIATTAPFKIDFKIRRGSSKDSLTPEDEDTTPRFVKRDGSFEMILTNEQTFYMASLKIGSNEDVNEVLVDTGSSDLWVMSHDLNCVPVLNTKRFERSFGQGTGVLPNHKLKKRQLPAARQPERERDVIQPSKTTEENEEEEEDVHNKLFGSYTTIYITDGSFPSNFLSGPSTGSGSGSGSNTCTSYGSFNTENSDTFRRNDTFPFAIQYADGTHALGIWGYDDVVINNVTVHDLSFAIANETSSDVGVLGIGLPWLEVTSQYGYIYENLPIKLAQQGIINKAIYSLYLDTADAQTGSILFGAIDHAKYEGDLATIDMMSSSRQISVPDRIKVPVSGIYYSDSDGNNATIMSGSTGVVLDTGSTLSYVFSDTLRSLGRALGGTYDSTQGAYVVDCDLRSSSETLDINFDGVKTISVPISDLVLRVSRSQCMLGVLAQSSSSSYMLFGDNILRSAYVVYDIEDYQVSLAQISYTNDESIEIIGSNGITNTTGSGASSSSSSSSGSGSGSGFNSGSSSGSSSTTSSRGIADGLAVPVQGLISSILAWFYFVM